MKVMLRGERESRAEEKFEEGEEKLGDSRCLPALPSSSVNLCPSAFSVNQRGRGTQLVD